MFLFIGYLIFGFYPIRFGGRDSEIAPTVGRFDLAFALIGELNDPTYLDTGLYLVRPFFEENRSDLRLIM